MKSRRLTTALLAGAAYLALGCRFLGSAHQTPGNPPKRRVKNTAVADHGAPPAPPKQPRTAPAPEAGQQAAASGDQDSKESRKWSRSEVIAAVSAAATLAGAAFAAVAFIAAMRTLGETRAQVQAARDANKISSQALAATVDSSVYFGHAQFRMSTNPRQVIKINVIVPIGNGGGTTTRRLIYAGTCSESATPQADPFSLARISKEPIHHITLAPKQTADLVVCSYNLVQWALITAQNEDIYLYGQASYQDTVNPDISHYVQFCGRLYDLGFTASPFNPGPFATGEECRHHNCADYECEAD